MGLDHFFYAGNKLLKLLKPFFVLPVRIHQQWRHDSDVNINSQSCKQTWPRLSA